MDPGITDIARYLASRIPTGAESDEERTADWRTTLYNARATNTVRPLRDLVSREVPDDPVARSLCESLLPPDRR
jgi:hypothetical protein